MGEVGLVCQAQSRPYSHRPCLRISCEDSHFAVERCVAAAFPGRLLGPTSILLSLEWSQQQDISLNQLTSIVRECRGQTGDEGGETETIVDNESGDRSAVVVVAASVRASAAFCAISLSFL